MDFSPILDVFFRSLWWAVPLLVFITLVRSPWFKGLQGEWLVKQAGKRLLPRATYHPIHNVTLPTTDGTTQIDHLYVSRFGIFVVETKNMKGWIFGNERQTQWTQKIFRQSFKFQNPLRQNYKHTKTLGLLLNIPDIHIHSVVVFVGDCTFKTPMPVNITRGIGFIRYIKTFDDVVFTEEQVQQFVGVIQARRLKPSLKTHNEHVAHLGAKFSSNRSKRRPMLRAVLKVILLIVLFFTAIHFIKASTQRQSVATAGHPPTQPKAASIVEQPSAASEKQKKAQLAAAREREKQKIYQAWQASYVEPPECAQYDSDEEMVWCANHKKRSRDAYFHKARAERER